MDRTAMNRSHDARLASLVVCPVCKGALDVSPDVASCTACGRRFPQPGEGYLDLLPEHLLERDDATHWQERQHEMETWYQDLIADPAWAASCFASDYEPYAPLLATLSGAVLDLGGGNGVARHYLPREVQHVVADPSLDWLGDEWKSIAERFPSLETRPRFVRGVGEHLPFPARSFDAVLAFWSLNHVSQPAQVFQEVSRVLKPGGLFLAVLEEMEPRWLDFLDPTFRCHALPKIAWMLRQAMTPGECHLLDRLFRAEKLRQAMTILLSKLRSRLPGQEWPTQDDHIRLHESDLRGWGAPHLKIARRSWGGHYLTYEFRKAALA